MKEARHEEALKALETAFGDRVRALEERKPGVAGAEISVTPVNAGEVRLLTDVARRYSIPLVPRGAGTIAASGETEGRILVRFDLMRRTHHPDDEPWAEAEPGTP